MRGLISNLNMSDKLLISLFEVGKGSWNGGSCQVSYYLAVEDDPGGFGHTLACLLFHPLTTSEGTRIKQKLVKGNDQKLHVSCRTAFTSSVVIALPHKKLVSTNRAESHATIDLVFHH
jgi:hypothetical protein